MEAINFLFCGTDASISFSSPSFTAVEENQVATICVILEDDIERDLTITFSSTEQCEIYCLSLYHCRPLPLNSLAATDFSDVSTNLTFTVGKGGRELCHNVLVTDDDILEDTETYMLILSSLDEDVIIQTSTALLVILDETDGKLTPDFKISLYICHLQR